LRQIGWMYRMARFTAWYGRGQELILALNDGEWVWLVPGPKESVPDSSRV